MLDVSRVFEKRAALTADAERFENKKEKRKKFAADYEIAQKSAQSQRSKRLRRKPSRGRSSLGISWYQLELRSEHNLIRMTSKNII